MIRIDQTSFATTFFKLSQKEEKYCKAEIELAGKRGKLFM
jgi:hypothetical protein